MGIGFTAHNPIAQTGPFVQLHYVLKEREELLEAVSSLSLLTLQFPQTLPTSKIQIYMKSHDSISIDNRNN